MTKTYLGNGCYAYPQPNGSVKVEWFERWNKRRQFRSVGMASARLLARILGERMPWPDRKVYNYVRKKVVN